MKVVSDISRKQINKRRYSTILILSIFSTQISTAAILDNLNIVSKNHASWEFFFYFISLFAAIIQAGFSDDYGRKKHLIISSVSVLISSFTLIFLIYLKKMYVIATFGPAIPCLILGALGNAIPIARGCLATLKNHDFRSLIGLTTLCIGFGWIVVNGLSLILKPIAVIVVSVLIQGATIVFIYKFYITDELPIKAKKSIIHTTKNSIKWIFKMAFVSGGAAAILAYLFSETSFYLPYILEELPEALNITKIMGLLMGIGYSAGVFSQIIIYPSDKRSIIFGVLFSFIFVIILLSSNISPLNIPKVFIRYISYIQTFSLFSFAYGFGFSVPALFSLMATKIHKNHVGRLFGVVDSADTGALWLSYGLISLKEKYQGAFILNIVNSLILTLYSISMIMYYKFIKSFKSYEEDS